uniref:SpoVT-AbrB domain-containing protein n=1 Tax=Candidatus Kentrum sp. FW TaxID=2126338 RepID=A0A450TGI4_9GAMM|nr:MAG: hypothetical protein BECKFW1821C_GA0114237_100931 [Candidatus Kentron sp. FW]
MLLEDGEAEMEPRFIGVQKTAVRSKMMQTMEFEATIDESGIIRLPQAYREAYGQQARFMLTIPDDGSTNVKVVNPIEYSHTVGWPMDGMDYRKRFRDEWE